MQILPIWILGCKVMTPSTIDKPVNWIRYWVRGVWLPVVSVYECSITPFRHISQTLESHGGKTLGIFVELSIVINIEAPESFRHLGGSGKFDDPFHGPLDVYNWQMNPLQLLPHGNYGIPDVLKVMFQIWMMINVGSFWQPCFDLESCHSFQV